MDETQIPSERVGSILVIRLRFLGDLVLMQPLFRNLREQFPTARITLATDQSFASPARSLAIADDVIAVPGSRSRGYWRSGGPIGSMLQLLRLRRRQYDVTIDAHCTRSSRALVVAAGSRWRIAWLDAAAKTYTHTVSLAHVGKHRIERLLALLRPLGTPIKHVAPRLAAAPRALQSVTSRLAQLEPVAAGYAVIHPGARMATRRWPADRFAAVAAHLRDVHSLPVFLIGGKGEAQECNDVQLAAGQRCHDLCGTLDVEELVALLGDCAVFVGNDSAPMHIAAATGARTVGIFGQQSPDEWGPVAEAGRIVRAPQPCGDACLAPGRCDRRSEYETICVRRNTVESVCSAVDSLLAEHFLSSSHRAGR